jgi:NitT/TauT family transport system permease protein/taurine transport system permease protein
MIKSGEIFRDIGISLVRVLIGFSLGSLAAIVMGVIMGRIRLINELLDPIIEVLRYLSPTAMIPIAVIWFGIGEQSKYFLIFWGTFFFVLINTVAGVIRTPLARQRAAQCLGANQFEIFLIVIIPSAIPYIITGMRVAMASSYMSIIPAEMLAAQSGLGHLLQVSGMLAQTDRIFVALAAISLLGFATDRLFRWLVHRTLNRYMAFVSVS